MMQMYMSFCQLAYPHQVLLYSIASTVQHCCPTYVHAHLTQLIYQGQCSDGCRHTRNHTHTHSRTCTRTCVCACANIMANGVRQTFRNLKSTVYGVRVHARYYSVLIHVVALERRQGTVHQRKMRWNSDCTHRNLTGNGQSMADVQNKRQSIIYTGTSHIYIYVVTILIHS